MLREYFEQSNKVYSLLEDKESKDIFMYKSMFYGSYDYRYIFEMVDRYTQLSTLDFRWDDFIKKIKYACEKGKKIVIYGAGGEGLALQTILNSQGIPVAFFADRNYELINRKDVVSPDELIDRYMANDDIVVVIGTEIYFEEIKNSLLKKGILLCDIFGGKADIEKQYFADEIIQYTSDEVFVDCGSLNFMTCEYFMKKCTTNVGKIFAFEPDDSNYNMCLDRINKHNLDIKLYPYGVYSENSVMGFVYNNGGTSRISQQGEGTIETCKLDDILKGERVTFIKMDIEGAEFEALKGAENLITKNRPKLAISVYHKPEDMIEIVLYLKSLVPEYKFYLRHYSIYSVETVMYAVL